VLRDQEKGNDAEKDVEGDFAGRSPPREARGMIRVMNHKTLLKVGLTV
jgi:hypothetical protein